MARNTRRRRNEPPPPDPDAGELFDDFLASDANNDGHLSPADELAGMTPEQAVAWIEQNAGSLTEQDRDEVNDWVTQQAGAAGLDGQDAWRPAVQAADALYYLEPAEDIEPGSNAPSVEEAIDDQTTQRDEEAAAAEQEALDSAREDAVAAAAEIYSNTAPGVEPDLSSIEELVPEGYDPNEQERWLTDVITQGRQEAVNQRAQDIQGATGADEGEAQQMAEGQIASDDLFGATEPDWLLQMNGGILSEQQKDRYVQYWNDAYGTFFRDFDTDLAPILARFDGTEAEAQNFASSVLAAQEPVISHSIELPLVSGTRQATFTQDQMEDLRAMGFSNDAITRMVRLSAFTGGREDAMAGDTSDTSNLRPLAALVRYYNGGSEFAAYTQSQQDIADLEQQLGLRPGAWGRMTAEERQQFRADLEARSYQSPTESRGTVQLDLVDQLETKTRQLGLREEHGGMVGILAANNNFRRGMEQYRNDELLALVYAIDPALAQRVAASGGDPEKLDPDDNSAVFDILEQGGVIQQDGMRLRQLESATGFFGYFETGGAPRGATGPVRRIVDPVAVKEQVQQLWSRMFLADVDDATVAAITANLQKQLDEAPEGMSFDATARIMAFLKGQDVYDELYRNKPEGLSEEEYQGQFAAGVSDMIGNELDPEALKAGMRTGDYQSAVGRAAASDKLLTNSTLRGRWAQAKQTLDRFS